MFQLLLDMLFDVLFTSDEPLQMDNLGGSSITLRREVDKSFIKFLCWPVTEDDYYFSPADGNNLSFALFLDAAIVRQDVDQPFADFVPVVTHERGVMNSAELLLRLQHLIGKCSLSPEPDILPGRLQELLPRLESPDYRSTVWQFLMYQTPSLDTNYVSYLGDVSLESNTDPLFQPFLNSVRSTLPVVIEDLRVDNFGFIEKYGEYLFYIFDCDVYWVQPRGALSGRKWLKSIMFEIESCHLNPTEDFYILGTDLYDELVESWWTGEKVGLTPTEWSLLMGDAEACMRNNYNLQGLGVTYEAEEIMSVTQFPIIYKQTSTGALQQWQVLIIPQEDGGYLLTTESGQVEGAITRGRGKLITEGKVNRTALEQAQLEARSKFNKKSDEGYFETMEEARNNIVLLPMLALDFNKRSHDIVWPAVAQRKFDGVRCLAVTKPDGSVHLMTRKGKEFPHLAHLREQIAALHLPTNLVLDGEVYSDSLTFQEVTGLVRRETLKPARDEEVPTNDGRFDPETGKPMTETVHILSDEEKLQQVDYRVYDAIVLDEPAMSFINRFAKLSSYFPEGVVRHGNLVLTENFPLRGPEDLSTLHRQFTQDEDYEGVMIRNLHGTYDLNKRSKHLQKFKTFQDAEYRIIGFDEASGNDEGTVVWIAETPAGQEFRVRPEGSREQRREWFENGEDYVGKMLTVKFFELTDDGIPRFPVGVAIRDYE